jgi:hypothetical protein
MMERIAQKLVITLVNVGQADAIALMKWKFSINSIMVN